MGTVRDAPALVLRATRAIRRDGARVTAAKVVRRGVKRTAPFKALQQKSKRQATEIASLRRQLKTLERAALKSPVRAASVAPLASAPNPADARVNARVRLFAVLGTWMEADVVADNV